MGNPRGIVFAYVSGCQGYHPAVKLPERKKAPALRAGAFVFPYGMFREGVTRG